MVTRKRHTGKTAAPIEQFRKNRLRLEAAGGFSYALIATVQIVTRNTSVKKSYNVIGTTPYGSRISRLPCWYTYLDTLYKNYTLMASLIWQILCDKLYRAALTRHVL